MKENIICKNSKGCLEGLNSKRHEYTQTATANKITTRRPMRIISIVSGILIGVIALVIIGVELSNSCVFPWEEHEAIKTTLEWGGLSELPEEIKNLNIDKRGSLLTRQFIIEFELEDSNKLNDWIKESKRLKNNIPTTKNNTRIYEIYPGENGSVGGTVEIQDKKVRINMSWS